MPEDTRNAEAVGTAAAAVGFLNQAEALMAGFRLQPHIDQDAMHAAFDKLYDMIDKV